MGVSLGSASEAEIAKLDRLLGQLANFKTADEVLTQERRREVQKEEEEDSEDDDDEEVEGSRTKGTTTWGHTLAGVCYSEALS